MTRSFDPQPRTQSGSTVAQNAGSSAEAAVDGGVIRTDDGARGEALRNNGKGRAPGSQRYYLLDAMRGIAAIAIMQFHMNYLWNAAQSAPVAVDLFFALSGFVLANSYLERLQGTKYLVPFLKARVIRLYPLYLFGFIASLVALVVERHLASTDSHYPVTIAFNLFMLPAPRAGLFFPFNGVAWSLFWELAVNLLFGIAARLVRPKILLWVIGVSGLYMLVRSAIFGLGGWTWVTSDIGATRTVYSFGIGCLFYCLNLQRREANMAMALFSACLVAGILYFPHLQGFSRIFGLFVIAIGNPLVLWLGIRYEFPPRLVPFAKFLGDISYPIYVLHMPLSYVLMPRLEATGMAPAACVMVYSAVTIAAGWLIVGVDERVRRSLTKAFLPRTSPAPVSIDANNAGGRDRAVG